MQYLTTIALTLALATVITGLLVAPVIITEEHQAQAVKGESATHISPQGAANPSPKGAANSGGGVCSGCV
jgi:hypothetical protein